MIEPNLPYVYPQEYVEFMNDARKKIEYIMGSPFGEAIRVLNCSDITKLGGFQNTYSKVIKLLREQNYEEQANLIEVRVAQIVEETKARNQYSQALGECEKDLALFSDVRNISYSECESIQNKLMAWRRFLQDANLPSSITISLNHRINDTMKSIEEKKKEIVDGVIAIDKEFDNINSLEALMRLKSIIESMLANNLPEKMDLHLMEKMKGIEQTEACVQKLPQTIDELATFIDTESNEARIVVLNEANKLYEHLLSNQQDWVEKNIIPVEEGTIIDVQKCSLWLERLTSIPIYADTKTVERAHRAADIVTRQLHECKVQGVLSLYNSLTQEEKKEFLRLIQQGWQCGFLE